MLNNNSEIKDIEALKSAVVDPNYKVLNWVGAPDEPSRYGIRAWRPVKTLKNLSDQLSSTIHSYSYRIEPVVLHSVDEVISLLKGKEHLRVEDSKLQAFLVALF